MMTTELRAPVEHTTAATINVQSTSFDRIHAGGSVLSAGEPRFKRINFLGVPIDCCSIDAVVEHATDAIRHRKRLQHGDVNVAKFITCKTDPEFCRYTEESDIICADGMGIVWGCKLMGLPVFERVTGIDLIMRVIEVCALEGFRPYFLGARKKILEKTIDEVCKQYPQLQVAGCRDGYFRPEDEAQIVSAIRATHADCLFVGISSPIKEMFLNRNRDALNVPVQLGVGGSFDVIAGEVPRAPVWMQRSGAEWLFRLSQEPRRLATRYSKTNARYAAILASAVAQRLLMKSAMPKENE